MDIKQAKQKAKQDGAIYYKNICVMCGLREVLYSITFFSSKNCTIDNNFSMEEIGHYNIDFKKYTPFHRWNSIDFLTTKNNSSHPLHLL